jgi:hypothetical protein
MKEAVVLNSHINGRNTDISSTVAGGKAGSDKRTTDPGTGNVSDSNSTPGNSPSERSDRAFSPRPAVQKEKEAKPMSELERRFATRNKSKSSSDDGENQS